MRSTDHVCKHVKVISYEILKWIYVTTNTFNELSKIILIRISTENETISTKFYHPDWRIERKNG